MSHELQCTSKTHQVASSVEDVTILSYQPITESRFIRPMRLKYRQVKEIINYYVAWIHA